MSHFLSIFSISLTFLLPIFGAFATVFLSKLRKTSKSLHPLKITSKATQIALKNTITDIRNQLSVTIIFFVFYSLFCFLTLWILIFIIINIKIILITLFIITLCICTIALIIYVIKNDKDNHSIQESNNNSYNFTENQLQPHFLNDTHSNSNNKTATTEVFTYEAKQHLISPNEQKYYEAIRKCLSSNYHVFPQINLATIINKTDGTPFHNELFRNVDFLITDTDYKPLICIEINDKTHNNPKRRYRDAKVKTICEEAGIPLITFWTSYGVQLDYIEKRIFETIISLPIERIPHHQ